MQRIDGQIHLSASDLVGHLSCRYKTNLDLDVAHGRIEKPIVWDPLLEVLVERGQQHEAAYVAYLRANGHQVAVIEGAAVDVVSVDQTLAAMRAGASIIVQGALRQGNWNGRVDVLRRVEHPSALGAWSYEVLDTKLALETKGSTVLQLCLYSALLEVAQGWQPEYAYVVTPESEEPERYRIADYAAYYRHVRRNLEGAVSAGATGALYPDPNPHCDICRWRQHCDSKRRTDDHLSLVAGISKAQIGELAKQSIVTAAALALMPIPLAWKPERGASESFEKVREQARLQVETRRVGRILHEVLPITPGLGLCRLPEPSPGDVFLDFEGDPFIGEGGLEYLFGYATGVDGGESYTADWALTRPDEKAAFERFIDVVLERRRQYPGMHIYHFAPYEPAALKRLMGRYATREDELDQLLRAELFVDLYAVTRQAVRVGVESYSIKKLEPLVGFTRSLPLDQAGTALAKVQACLELGDLDGLSDADRAAVQGYNRDDCLAAAKLRRWLEAVRLTAINAGAAIARPVPKLGEASEAISTWQQRVEALIPRLTADVPVDPAERAAAQQARWILAYLLDWHRREEKSVWWEHFRLRDLSDAELLDERAAIAGMKFVGNAGGTARAPIHRYRFPPQDTDLRGEEELRSAGGNKFGEVVSVDPVARTIDIKKRQDTASFHASAVYAHKMIGGAVFGEARMRLGEYVAANGIEGAGQFQAARDLLLRLPPRVGIAALRRQGETTVTSAERLAPLSQGVLPVQGPPGAGKTFTGARMVLALVAAGMKVGVTANSHKVIRNLLDEVRRAAAEAGRPVRCLQKPSAKEPNVPGLDFAMTNKEFLDSLRSAYQVGGATGFFWSLPEATGSVDVLFIDEAAQMSLANVLAVSQAARSIVLLGDPRQLEQPIQGTHPDGTAVSALDHILGEHATIPEDRGLFLEETWRLHPEICAFTSELFYDGRLRSRPSLERQAIRSASGISGTGLRYVPVDHQGNQSSSPEEAAAVRQLVDAILAGNTTWIDREGVEKPLGLSDVLIIAPYNAQVYELQQRIPSGRIGTVDKFQGQEAPIVIYSMTTSSHADAPRGMEFLYSANRLNVATSRARCLCILVGARSVFEAETRTPRQMLLANGFCRYLELASEIEVPGAAPVAAPQHGTQPQLPDW